MVAIRRSTLEVNGAYLLGIVEAVKNDIICNLLARYGLDFIEPGHWYPAEDVIRFYEALAARPAGGFDLVQIGKHIIANLTYPPEVETMGHALAVAKQMHRAAWRGGDPGSLQTRVLSDKHVCFYFEGLPLPPDLIYGICYGMIERFNPAARTIVVRQVQQGDCMSFDMRW